VGGRGEKRYSKKVPQLKKREGSLSRRKKKGGRKSKKKKKKPFTLEKFCVNGREGIYLEKKRGKSLGG